MSRKALWSTVAVGLLAVAAWWVVPSSTGNSSESASQDVDPIAADRTPSAERRSTASARDTRTASRPPSSSETRSDAERVLSRYYEPLIGPGDEATLRQRTPLEQILTPTSERDAQWMHRALYPRREDMEGADLARWERVLQEGHPVHDRDAMAYAANVLAAHYYRNGDARWREFASQSFGPFPAMLNLAEAKRRFEAGEIETRELAQVLAHAQVVGEPDATRMLEHIRVNPPRIDGLMYAELVRSQVRMLERLNRDANRRGEPPYHTAPRPAPPWDGGP